MNKLNNNSEQVDIPLLKRAFDVLFSFVIIIATLPITSIILLAIFIEHILIHKTFASLFYVEKRISKGSQFNLIKFNIFKPGVLEDLRRRGVFIHTKPLEHDGHSLTHVGRLLQKMYLDEFPQFFSILIGDISLVGPRPVNLEVYNDQLKAGNNTRTLIKSGLTGGFQAVKGLPVKDNTDLDYQYIEHCRNNNSFKILILDLKIILKTIKILFMAKGI